MEMKHIYNDGGRKAAGFKGETRDCVCRAIAIAMERPYQNVYDDLNRKCNDAQTPRCMGKNSARTGISKEIIKSYLEQYGWRRVNCMTFGSGCQVHLRDNEVPMTGRIIVQLSRHLCTVIDGTIHDIFDPSRNGTRCVYGYWIKA